MSALIAVVVAGCTPGPAKEFQVRETFAVSSAPDEPLFELELVGGDPEPIEHVRVELDQVALSGGLYAASDTGDLALEIIEDGGSAGMIDEGDVVQIRERERSFSDLDAGQVWTINVMLLPESQRNSQAATRSWSSVWSGPWTVGS